MQLYQLAVRLEASKSSGGCAAWEGGLCTLQAKAPTTGTILQIGVVLRIRSNCLIRNVQARLCVLVLTMDSGGLGVLMLGCHDQQGVQG